MVATKFYRKIFCQMTQVQKIWTWIKVYSKKVILYLKYLIFIYYFDLHYIVLI